MITSVEKYNNMIISDICIYYFYFGILKLKMAVSLQ